MRLRLLATLALLGALAHATAADEVILRGNYYRDRNTRVLQPEIDFSKELPSGTIIGGHYLLDAITSASVAAGVIRDEPFTELRNEFGVRLGQRLMKVWRLNASYSYSSESDYRAQLLTLGVVGELADKNTTLGLTLAYGHDDVSARVSPTSAVAVGGLDSLTIVTGLSQVVSPTAVLNVSYDVSILGFGRKDNGFQANPYRPVNLGNSPDRETVPFQRIRHAFAASIHWAFPMRSAIVPFIALRPSYRIYFDDWGVLSHTPELRLTVPVRPLEFRVTGRYYGQSQASFWNDQGDGVPVYPTGKGKPCTGCLSSSTNGQLYYTADPKLSDFTTFFIEIRVLLHLRFLRPVSRWLSQGFIEASYGHLFTDGALYRTFGDAHVAGLTLQFPL